MILWYEAILMEKAHPYPLLQIRMIRPRKKESIGDK